MRVWRISNYTDLRGLGGVKSGARWHSRGKPIVYTCDHPAAALLEKLVHFEFESTDDMPTTYRLLEIEVPTKITKIAPGVLPENWRSEEESTRGIGDAWLRAEKSAVLAVPSAVTPHAWNYLINPRHPECHRIRVISSAEYPFDLRLFRVPTRRRS